MSNVIAIKKIWQDVDFFEIEIECQSNLITARTQIYTTDKLVEMLIDHIDLFLSGTVDTITWQNGERGNSTPASIALTFLHKDRLGHIQVEVYMEIDDGGLFNSHNCCFFINTEIGLLYQFKDKLQELKILSIGDQIILNGTD